MIIAAAVTYLEKIPGVVGQISKATSDALFLWITVIDVVIACGV